MNKKIKGMLFIILLILPSMLLAQEREYPDIDYGIHPAPFEQIGMSGWQFLKLPTNARYAALGGVTSVISHGDASAAFANPASIADVENISVAVSKMTWLVDTDYQSASIVKNFGQLGFIGLNFVYLDYGDMQRTQVTNLTDPSTGQLTGLSELTLSGLGTYTAHDLAIGLSYARNITDRLQVGGNLRYIQEKLDDATTSNISFDIGTVYYTGLKSLRLAMVGRNFGPDAEFVQWDERIAYPATKVYMPMSFTLGAAIDVLERGEDSPHQWTLAADFLHPNDGPEKVNVGTEYSFLDLLYLRAGYRFNYDEETVTFGGGVNVSMAGSLKFKANYAFLDFGRLDNVHMISLGVDF